MNMHLLDNVSLFIVGSTSQVVHRWLARNFWS